MQCQYGVPTRGTSGSRVHSGRGDLGRTLSRSAQTRLDFDAAAAAAGEDAAHRWREAEQWRLRPRGERVRVVVRAEAHDSAVGERGEHVFASAQAHHGLGQAW